MDHSERAAGRFGARRDPASPVDSLGVGPARGEEPVAADTHPQQCVVRAPIRGDLLAGAPAPGPSARRHIACSVSESPSPAVAAGFAGGRRLATREVLVPGLKRAPSRGLMPVASRRACRFPPAPTPQPISSVPSGRTFAQQPPQVAPSEGGAEGAAQDTGERRAIIATGRGDRSTPCGRDPAVGQVARRREQPS